MRTSTHEHGDWIHQRRCTLFNDCRVRVGRSICQVGGVSRSRTFALVVAHPDDDAFALAGTVALHGDDPGFRFVLVHATDGGAGDIRAGFPATPRAPTRCSGSAMLSPVATFTRPCSTPPDCAGRSDERHAVTGHPAASTGLSTVVAGSVA